MTQMAKATPSSNGGQQGSADRQALATTQPTSLGAPAPLGAPSDATRERNVQQSDAVLRTHEHADAPVQNDPNHSAPKDDALPVANLPAEHVDNIVKAKDDKAQVAQGVDMQRIDAVKPAELDIKPEAQKEDPDPEQLNVWHEPSNEAVEQPKPAVDQAKPAVDQAKPAEDQPKPPAEQPKQDAPPGPAKTPEDEVAADLQDVIENAASVFLATKESEVDAEVAKLEKSGQVDEAELEKFANQEDDEEDSEDPDPSEVHIHPQPPAQAQPQPQPAYKPPQEKPDPLFDAVGKSSTAVGQVGTEGNNTFGMGKNYWKNGEQTDWTDKTTPAQSDEGHALTSGVSDMVRGVGGAAAIGVKLTTAKQKAAIVTDKTKSTAERAQALIELSQIAIGVEQQISVVGGGFARSLEGTGVVHDQSSFGFSATGGSSISTDFKAAGEVGGMLLELTSVVTDVLKIVNNDEDARTKLLKGPQHEQVGRITQLAIETTNKLGNVAKNLVMFIGQIQGHGQIDKVASATTAASEGFKVFGGAVMPVVGSVVATGKIVKQSYNINKFRKRKKALKKLVQSGELSGPKQLEAVAFINEVLQKRIVRAGIDIGLSSADLVGGVLVAATPVGAAAGTAIAATTATVRLGQVATRVIKQKLRDRKAKSRVNANDPYETYAKWAERQRAKGLKGKLNAAVTMNWDKSSDKKKERYIEHARTILEMDKPEVYAGIGLTKEKVDALKNDPKKQLETVIKALQKR